MLNCGVSSPSLNNQINSGVSGFCGLPEPNGMFGKKSVYRTDPHQTAPNKKNLEFDFHFNFSILFIKLEENYL